MKLQELLRDLPGVKVEGATDKEILNIEFDSRKAGRESLFVAVKGVNADGHDFIEKAIKNGAEVIVAERIMEKRDPKVTWIIVGNSAAALGRLAAAFYGHPSKKLKLVGVTGTNGKTTVATLLYRLFSDMGYKTGLLSTIENKIGAMVLDATHTTPDAVALNALLSEMVEAGCDYAFMEVSSHAIWQSRIAGVTFTGAIFTNLTHDHLDYHKTFKAYIEAKKKFFDDLPKSAFALVNVDDKRGNVMVQNTAAKIYRYSLHNLVDFKAKIIENSLKGLHLELDNTEFFSRLIGDFNAYNLLAVYGTARLLGFDKLEVMQALSNLKTAEGRFDYVMDEKGDRIGIVDYAHTPDALEKVLHTIFELRQNDVKIITVFGCGGDRDRTKRPKMAKVAADYSDQVILTSDNPRSEEPAAIIREMEEGLPAYGKHKALSIEDRKNAIKTACRLAQKGDIVLIAGKGHEKYQEIKGVKYPFDDKKILKEAFMDF
ncbi:MAG: UDP-N-acetylmuramoyl-L-alanyl-D-glutamate--2,6-diaminopimelate ligase [Saprospiraceae bacterium]|nr:UDP-N-acetylmuramoyl-L-alanyl-D-glutamate--2,6-diaminopimelate ligase [Saprospiraceae bacterium]MCB9323296.1 UDP-N-acetylmuramoyl-L-alanyl-D-glutamate--2,6-diaminopimelate ligase [Lewinellaceae bacterium]